MAWIKRNLYFVITIAVGLGLTGYCGYLLYSALGDNAAASDQYTSNKSALEELLKTSPFPSKENIEAAEKDQARVRAFLAEFRKPFAAFPVPPKVDDREFKDFLQRSVVQLGLDATNSGVGLYPDYSFSWTGQIAKLTYDPEYIAPWMQELEEEKALLRILFDAKINFLYRIKRPCIGPEDSGGDDYTQLGTVSNQWGTVTPYMVNFRSFSTEIANVLTAIASSSNCFIVKDVSVSPDREVRLPDYAEAEQQPTIVMRQIRRQPSPDQYMEEGGGRTGRGGMRERRAPQPSYTQVPVEIPAAPAGPVTILTERPLSVTVFIDVVKLKPAEVPKVAAKPAAGRARR